MNVGEETILIKLSDFNSLMEDSASLAELEDRGVDNWAGYSDAKQAYADRVADEQVNELEG
jgi:hypothetical protein